MKYKIVPTKKFAKDIKAAKKRSYDLALLDEIIKKLANDIPLPRKNKDHSLKGKFKNLRECHVLPDWLLVYEKDAGELYLYLMRTGTHSDLFGE